ncbi:hypothetical protein BT69DRAFT_1332877 [Atractiella rhizophila]|nr:hypothetical protein BT69DRAFT_1332877 [Atractiella rhizophila]
MSDPERESPVDEKNTEIENAKHTQGPSEVEKETIEDEKKPAEEKKRRFDKTFESKEKGPKHTLIDISRIEPKAEDLYDKEKVDLEQVGMDDVWQLLQ